MKKIIYFHYLSKTDGKPWIQYYQILIIALYQLLKGSKDPMIHIIEKLMTLKQILIYIVK